MSAGAYVAKYLAKIDQTGAGCIGVDASWWRSHSEPHASGLWTMAVWGANLPVFVAEGVVGDFGDLVAVSRWVQ